MHDHSTVKDADCELAGIHQGTELVRQFLELRDSLLGLGFLGSKRSEGTLPLGEGPGQFATSIGSAIELAFESTDLSMSLNQRGLDLADRPSRGCRTCLKLRILSSTSEARARRE